MTESVGLEIMVWFLEGAFHRKDAGLWVTVNARGSELGTVEYSVLTYR